MSVAFPTLFDIFNLFQTSLTKCWYLIQTMFMLLSWFLGSNNIFGATGLSQPINLLTP